MTSNYIKAVSAKVFADILSDDGFCNIDVFGEARVSEKAYKKPMELDVSLEQFVKKDD